LGAQAFVDLKKFLCLGPVANFGRKLWELTAIPTGGAFIQNFAEGKEVGLGRSRAVGGKVTFRTNDRKRVAGIGHQTDIRQLGAAIDENNVGWLDVAMDQTVRVQVAEGFCESKPDLKHAVSGQSAATEVCTQGMGRVGVRNGRR
jgi:hypothetical protein